MPKRHQNKKEPHGRQGPVFQLPRVTEYGNELLRPKTWVQLGAWWHRFRMVHKYPIYCMVLASYLHEEAVRMMETYPAEIDRVTGDKCGFIYIRDLSKASRLAPFDFDAEYIVWINTVRYILKISPDNLPCLMFFRRLDTQEYVLVSLDGKTAEESVELLEEITFYLADAKDEELFDKVKKFQRAQSFTVAKTKIGRNFFEFAVNVTAEFMKSFFPS